MECKMAKGLTVYFVQDATSDYRQAQIDAREGKVKLSPGRPGTTMVEVIQGVSNGNKKAKPPQHRPARSPRP